MIAVDNFVGTPKKAHHLLGICFAELLEESRGAGLEFPTFDFEILESLVGHYDVYATTVSL